MTLTIAVALARDRLPLSETRDVDVLLRPCLLFVSFFVLFGWMVAGMSSSVVAW